ncbi:hypothetical protein ABTC22_18760, partial [Acinetobacter baumannii]
WDEDGTVVPGYCPGMQRDGLSYNCGQPGCHHFANLDQDFRSALALGNRDGCAVFIDPKGTIMASDRNGQTCARLRVSHRGRTEQ